MNQLQRKPSKQNPFNQAYFASKSTILNWASDLLKLNLTTYDQLQTGAVFCQLLDACHPGTVNLHRVKWKANSETEYIQNFILFQQGMKDNDINKPIDINLLSKGKQYALNELLQWMYGYYIKIKGNNNNKRELYDAFARRGRQDFVFNNKKKEINNKYKKKNNIKNLKDRDNLTQISTTSNNSSLYNNSTNSDIDGNNLRNYRNNKYNVSCLRQNLRNNNYNGYNNNYDNQNNYNDNMYRNKSKQEKRNNQYEEKILYSNNNNNYTQNKKNYYDNNDNNVNNVNINYSNNNYYTQNKPYEKNNSRKKYYNNNSNNLATINRYPSTPNININSNDANNYIAKSNRNFPNIFEKNPSQYQAYLTKQLNSNESFNEENIIKDYNSQLFNNNLEENDINNELEDNELDITDFFGLNEEETKNIIEEEKKDGNKIKDLKNIIRKLRINIIAKDKDLNNMKRVISEEYKLKNFYLNKLKDIEYLYFNPVIKNTNENKNTILRQLLCSNQDSTIFLDENNYAYLEQRNKSKSKKKINNINKDMDMNINMDLEEKKINIDVSKNNEAKKLNFSSRKNYDTNYMDNLFDSFNNNVSSNNNNNDNVKNENYNNYNLNNNVKIHKIIPIKMCSENNSKLTNISSNTFYSNNNMTKVSNNENEININNENKEDNGNNNYIINGKKYITYSEKKKENEEQMKKISTKTEFKRNNNIYSDISSQLLNESLHIPNI